MRPRPAVVTCECATARGSGRVFVGGMSAGSGAVLSHRVHGRVIVVRALVGAGCCAQCSWADRRREWPELREQRPPETVSDPTAVRLWVGHGLTVTRDGARLPPGRPPPRRPVGWRWTGYPTRSQAAECRALMRFRSRRCRCRPGPTAPSEEGVVPLPFLLRARARAVIRSVGESCAGGPVTNTGLPGCTSRCPPSL